MHPAHCFLHLLTKTIFLFLGFHFFYQASNDCHFVLVGAEEARPELLPKLVQLLSTARSGDEESLSDEECLILDSWYGLDQTSKLLHLLLAKGVEHAGLLRGARCTQSLIVCS